MTTRRFAQLLVVPALVAACTDEGAAPGAAGAASSSTSGPSASSGAAGGPPAVPIETDVVVVGAGSGGVAAAIQAARMGAKVVLVESTDWVGGQMTAAGVSTMDGGAAPPARSGIYDELVKAVEAHYADTTLFPPSGKSVSTCYSAPGTTCFEPHVGRELLGDMIDAAGVELRLRARPSAVLREGDRVTGVVLGDGQQIDAKIVIDATETGDVLPLAGALYRIGNATSDDIDPGACIQSLTYLAIIKRYPGGVPPELVIDAPPPGYADFEPRFSTIVAANGSPELPPYPVNWPRHNRYRGLPDSSNPESYTNAEQDLITKTGVNWANDYPGYAIADVGGQQTAAWVDELGVGYLEDARARRSADCDAKLETLSFLYYAQQELGAADWSVADDEGYDSPYNVEENACEAMPAALRPLERRLAVMPYVREGRRIAAVHTLTAKEIFRDVGVAPSNAATSIAVGDYGTDLHNCSDDATLEGYLGESEADRSLASGPFQVPFGSMIPETVDGLLAAEKNIGVTRLAAGAIRLQPITMATGQAAGAIAALAVEGGVQPRQLAPVRVQAALLAAGSALSLHPFDDVPPGSPDWAAVQLADVHEVVGGASATHFGLADPRSRAEGAVMAATLFALDVSTPPVTATFDDVPPGHWAYAHIEAIHAAGLASGCSVSPPLFCPDSLQTRGQLAVFVVKGLGLDPGAAPATPYFDDVPATHPFFAFVQLAMQEKLVTGCSQSPPLFCPDDAVVRAVAARTAYAVLTR